MDSIPVTRSTPRQCLAICGNGGKILIVGVISGPLRRRAASCPCRALPPAFASTTAVGPGRTIQARIKGRERFCRFVATQRSPVQDGTGRAPSAKPTYASTPCASGELSLRIRYGGPAVRR